MRALVTTGILVVGVAAVFAMTRGTWPKRLRGTYIVQSCTTPLDVERVPVEIRTSSGVLLADTLTSEGRQWSDRVHGSADSGSACYVTFQAEVPKQQFYRVQIMDGSQGEAVYELKSLEETWGWCVQMGRPPVPEGLVAPPCP